MNTDRAPGGVKDGLMHNPGRRFPLIISPEGYDLLSHLSEEEKAIGKEMLRVKMANIPGVEQPPEHAAVQLRNPSMMFQHDPELFQREMVDYDRMSELVMGLTTVEIMEATDKDGLRVDDPDIKRRHSNSMLMVTKIAHDFRDEWTLSLMTTFPGWTLSKQQFCLLGQPQSAVWSDEQRMVLEYTAAVIHRKLDDVLFARVRAEWGTTQMLRYTQWITYYVRLIAFDCVNITDAERHGHL